MDSSVSTGQGLTLRVSQLTGEAWEGALVQFTGGTMTAHFWGADLPTLGLAREVEIEVGGLDLNLPPLQGSAIERIEMPGGRAFRFGYTLTNDFLQHIPKSLQVLFPYRSFHRVRPNDAHPLEARVRLSADSSWQPASVVDVSMAGIGLEVAVDVESQLGPASRVEIMLEFPGSDDASVVLGATIQHRRIRGGTVHYGVEFLKSSLDGLAEQAQGEITALERFVRSLES